MLYAVETGKREYLDITDLQKFLGRKLAFQNIQHHDHSGPARCS
jgi:hypothetical protein